MAESSNSAVRHGEGPNAGDTKHLVKQGECMASLGARYGFHWQVLWDHPLNAELKKRRKDPHVLFPGDVVTIPKKMLREEPGATEQRHRFKLKGVPETLRIRLLDEFDRPCSGVPYELWIGVRSWQGVTNGDGELQERIPPLAQEGRLFVDKERREIVLHIGALDPLEEVSGIQARLANLGYDPGPVDGVVGPSTRQALRDFQDQHGLEISGDLDNLSREKLKDLHGH